VAYAVTVFLVGRLGYRFRGFWCGLLAIALCASNPLLVQEALSIRPYALTALTATLSVTCLVGWLEDEKIWQMWCFAIAAVATAVLQLFAVLVPLVALAAVLALRRRVVKERWRHLVAPLGVAGVASLAFALYTLGQRGQISWIRHFTLSSFVVALYGPMGGDDHVGRIAYALTVAGLLVVGLVTIFLSRIRLKAEIARRDLDPFVVAAPWAILPAVILIVASFVTPIDVNRYLTDSTPGLALLVALVVTLSFQLRDATSHRVPIGRLATVGAAAILMIVSISLSTRYIAEYTQQGATRLASDVESSGVAAFPNRLVDEEFETYLAAKHVALWPLIAHPRTFNEMDLQFLPLSKTPRNVWLVTDFSSTDAAEVFIKILRTDGYKRVTVQAYPGYIGLYLNHYRR
jgi:4-amino-4-deoxy-L-arabinose transferase-like glycosyltransferase